jgi:hypothetical protein
VDDVATTMRRMIVLIPALPPDERKRITDYLKQSEPGAEQVLAALANSK